MRAFYALAAVGGVLLSAYGCDGSTESLKPVTTSTGSGGASGGAGGASSATGGGGANQGGAASGGGGGAASASGGSNAGGSGGAASGGASAGGSSGTSSGGAGGGPPPPECTTQNDTCAAGKYCDAPGCGAGHCKNKPTEGMTNEEGLVCGCDGVTYWNAHFASHSGVSVAMAGACPGGSGPACSVNQPCPAGLTCNVEVAGVADCSPLAVGECWGIPSECPTDGPQGKACSDGSCQYLCALIASQHSWYDDGGCP